MLELGFLSLELIYPSSVMCNFQMVHGSGSSVYGIGQYVYGTISMACL